VSCRRQVFGRCIGLFLERYRALLQRRYRRGKKLCLLQHVWCLWLTTKDNTTIHSEIKKFRQKSQIVEVCECCACLFMCDFAQNTTPQVMALIRGVTQYVESWHTHERVMALIRGVTHVWCSNTSSLAKDAKVSAKETYIVSPKETLQNMFVWPNMNESWHSYESSLARQIYFSWHTYEFI